MRLEQRSFRIQEKLDVDDVAGELDKAFADGWRYVSCFPVGRGHVLVLERLVVENGQIEPKKARVATKA